MHLRQSIMENQIVLMTIILLLSCICYIPFYTFLSTSWNYDYSHVLDHRKVNDWGFSMYFDDRYNFVDYPHLNSLFPQRDLYDQFYAINADNSPDYHHSQQQQQQQQHEISLFEHWRAILVHGGINVYEPVYNFHKAFFCDLIGFHPIKLRILSVIIHTINACLLFHWLRYLFEWNALSGDNKSMKKVSSVSLVLAAVVFYVHPLNMEVVGWLSAQGYVFAMFYSLLSLIAVERFFYVTRTDSKNNINRTLLYLVGSIISYLFASWSKAPAMMIGFLLMMRISIIALFRYASRQAISSNTIFLWISGCFLAFAGLLFSTISSNDISVPDINAVELLKIENYFLNLAGIKLMRAMTIFGAFAVRFVVPTDLRSHYYAPPSSHFFSDSLIEHQPHYLVHIAVSTMLALGSFHWFHKILSSILANRQNLSLSKASVDLQSLVRFCNLVFGLVGYAMMWIPGCGLIQHGWTQLGADRYNYFPIAALCPLLVEVINMVLHDDAIPVVSVIDQIECAPLSEDHHVNDETPEDIHEVIPKTVKPFKPFPSHDDKPTLKAILKSKLNNLQILGDESHEESDGSGNVSPLVSPTENSSTSGLDSPNKKRVQFILPEVKETSKKDKQRNQKENQNKLKPNASKASSGTTIIKVEDKRYVKLASLYFLAIALVLTWCTMLALVGRRSFEYWKNDQILLSNCVRLDPQDWECAQYLSTYHLMHSGKKNLADYFNAMTVHLMPTEPPRLQMFKATLLVQSPFPVQQHRNVRSAIYGNTDKDWNGDASINAENTDNLLHACTVVDSVVESLIHRLLRFYPQYRTLLDGSFDEQFQTIFTNMDILSKILEDQVPMIISNQVTCYLYRGGLNGSTATKAVTILKYSYDKLGFDKIYSAYKDKHSKPLFAQHVTSIKNHIDNLEYWRKFQSGSYDAVFLH